MKYYNCTYCSKEFEPTRRRVQKYCSNTCRSKAHHARKTVTNKKTLQKNTLENLQTNSTPTKTKIETMSASGVGNATAGNLIADGLKAMFTSDKNKPATKGDISDLISLIKKRYLPIENMHTDQFGRFPFYDVDTKSVVYLNKK